MDSKLIEQASKVTVLGGSGGIGQPLSLLMKLNPRVTDLALYDIRGAPGSRISLLLEKMTLTSEQVLLPTSVTSIRKALLPDSMPVMMG